MFYRSSPKVTKHLGYLCDETYAQEIKKITQSGHIDLDRSAAHVIGKALMAIKLVSVASVTIWIDFYTIFGHLQQIRFSPINIFFKSRSIILPNTKKPLKYLLKYFLNFTKVAKFRHIWSPWVTATSVVLTVGWFPFAECQRHYYYYLCQEKTRSRHWFREVSKSN